MAHIGFDLDGVLADFAGAFIPWYNARHGIAFREDDFWTHDFYEVFGVSREQLNAEIMVFVQTPHAEEIQPYQDMPAIVKRLARKHRLSQVTARFTPEAQQRAQIFNERHYPGCFENIHISHHVQQNPRGYKGAVCKREGISILVEDQINYAEEVLDHSIPVILIKRPWNIHQTIPACIPRIAVGDLEATLAHLLNGQH